jgi:YVTN family beta-propeller protein
LRSPSRRMGNMPCAAGQAIAQFLYVTNGDTGTVSVIATASNTVVATVQVWNFSFGVAVTPDGKHV